MWFQFRLLVLVALTTFSVNGTTFFIRADGGTAQQCTGLADAPYSGAGTAQACARSHPFHALDSQGRWRIAGGGRLLMDPHRIRQLHARPRGAEFRLVQPRLALGLPSSPRAEWAQRHAEDHHWRNAIFAEMRQVMETPQGQPRLQHLPDHPQLLSQHRGALPRLHPLHRRFLEFQTESPAPPDLPFCFRYHS